MKSRRGRDDSCSCSTCFYKHYKTKGIERTGSKIDRLYRDKYLPLRESKLIDKLERTRAVYDDIRAPFLDDSESNRNITRIKRSGSYESCNCCRCTRKFNNINGHSDVSSVYTRQNSKRRVRFKPEFNKSEPCICLAKFSSLLKKQSKNLQSKLKRDFSAPVLRIKIKEPSLYKINRASSRSSRVSKNFNNTSRKVNAQVRSVISERKLFPEKKSGIKTNSDEMLKLSVKKPSKSRHRVGDVKYKNNNGSPKYQKELNPRLCPCPQEKLVLKIRKDSIRKFYEDLEKKRTLKHLECKSDCVQDICIPKECLDKIKLSKGKKSTKRRRKSLKQIVSKASRRKKKKSVMCQCDDTITDGKNQTPVRQNFVKFVSSKKDIRNKSLKGNAATFDRLESKTDDGNRLKRCFCTLKFKPAEPQKYTLTPDYYSHSGQSGDMKINSTHMHRTAKKSKSSCSVYGCDPNECIEEYNKRKRQITKNDFTELNENNRRVVRFGSSISFNIEFFKENKPEDTHKSVKTNTVPHYLSSKSIKSIGPRKSNKFFTKNNKRKVTILDTASKNKDLEMKTNSNKIVTKLRKYAKSKSKIKSSFKDIKLENEMVDQSTKITNKEMRLMKSFECESKICVPGRCDPRLCLEKINQQKHEITTTDFPKMISVASGVHKRKFKHVKAQSKSSFRKRKSAKYDLNTFEDSEQLESNVVPTYPKMNHRTSIGLSSNFSFAIEVGRRVVPINPIESIKRHSPIFKAQKIKSPINYDSNNYTQRNNKSKTSVINTMVKRCMCTLNLTKQRNRNKSMNEQFGANVYTVNTLLTSNIESVLAKAMSEKKLPCQIPPNEYKICNISNSYAAWHSQIICNYMHISQNNNVTPKKLLKQLMLQSQLKNNNLCLLSKSLSFLSDTELKKTWLVAGTPWQFAEGKTVLCESSESKLYHVGEHQTFTKSSQYWEKTYCTMNLKTIYSRNGKIKDQVQKESRNNSVRVGSNISLNIAFYKDNPCLEIKHDTLPVTITRKDDSLRRKMTQNAITSSNKASYSVPKDQRCFCTMKLQNKSRGKNIDKSKQEPSKLTLKPAVSYVSRSQNTPGTKMNTIRLQPQEQLLPRECIPDMCVPGECDPASCYKILYKRKLKTRSISAATKTTRKVQAGVLTQQPSFKNAKIQSQSNSHKKRNEQVYVKRQSVPYDYIDSGKRCTRFGSQIGFNVEFYKESVPTSKNYDHELYGKKYDKLSKHIHEASVTTKTQDLRPAKSSARRGDSLIKRCFCTLKLRNKQKKPLLTEVHSVGVMAGVKNKWYSDKVLSNKENSNKGNATSVYNTTSILRKPKQSFTKEKVTKSKHGRQHITMAALLPYECEPGICDPGACNPYECLQRIEARNLIRKNIGSGTSRLNKKSLGTSNKFGIPSKHRRIQTSFQQNDIGVSRVVPKKAKPKYDTFSSNNQCVRIGSSINFSIEFFKDNCDGTLRHKTNKGADVVKTSSRSHKPLTNTKAIMSNFTSKRKGTKHTSNKSQEPIVNFQVSSKKQTASQLSQTRRKYFSKNKGLLPYECEPNVCIPGQCDPYKCHERIQKRIYKDCSAITVSNVRDFATNATPCCTCKSKRIQTGHHYREDVANGIRFKKSVPDHKSRNYVRIGSNFGFHIEFGKKEVDGLREVPVDDSEYRHKKVNRRLRDEASQSRHIKRRSQSTFARSKLQKCFCTKKFFNSSARTANRNLEYMTNCALVSNIIPTVNNIYNMNNNRGSQHFARLEKQKNLEVSARHIKNNLRPKRLLKFRRNTLKFLNQHKMRSYLSFDLDLYKSKKFTNESLNKNQKKMHSDLNVINSKEKSNIKRLKGLKTIDSKSIQGQGDTEKTVLLKRCFSTFNFSSYCEKKSKSEQDSVESHETIQQELEKRYRIKYIFTDTSAAKNLHPPRAKIIKSSKIYENLFKANNIHVFFYKCPDEYILSTKKNLIEVKKYHPNCNEDNKEKNNYIRNIYSKLHPYVDKMNFRRFFKNLISRRHCVKIAETNR